MNEWLTDKVRRVSPRLLDKHSMCCEACHERLERVKQLFGLNMEKLEEVIARDLTLEQLYEECCDCVLEVR